MEPLFELEPEQENREHHACEKCLTGAWCSPDTLRVRGWLVYDGLSLTNEPLHVRICPACQKEKT